MIVLNVFLARKSDRGHHFGETDIIASRGEIMAALGDLLTNGDDDDDNS